MDDELTRIMDELNSPDDWVRYKACMEVLDRCGFPALDEFYRGNDLGL
jgi:hypothetical protein